MSKQELALARRTLLNSVEAAGVIQLGGLKEGVEVERKGERDIVTEIDRRCEERVIQIIRAAHPGHPILAEEGSAATRPSAVGPLWVLDPLDGTKNYAHRQPRFACSLALLWDGKPLLGAIYAPALAELFIAERGTGATVNGQALKVSDTLELSRALIGTALTVRNQPDRRHLARVDKLIERAQSVRIHGCASLELCDVARGRLDAYVEEGLNAWDVAAGTLLVQEAGGIVTTFSGDAYDLFGRETLAASPAIGAATVALLAERAKVS